MMLNYSAASSRISYLYKWYYFYGLIRVAFTVIWNPKIDLCVFLPVRALFQAIFKLCKKQNDKTSFVSLQPRFLYKIDLLVSLKQALPDFCLFYKTNMKMYSLHLRKLWRI